MVVFLHVSPDAFGGLMRVGINQPEDDTLRGELRVKPPDLGRVTIRDRAVRSSGSDRAESIWPTPLCPTATSKATRSAKSTRLVPQLDNTENLPLGVIRPLLASFE